VGLTVWLAGDFATVLRQMRRALLLALVPSVLLWAPSALAQTPAPEPGAQPAPPGPPPPPDLVLSGRNVRMTRTGVVGIKLGCRANAAPGEACIGSLTVRLAKAIVIVVPPPPNKPKAKPRVRTISPFNFGVIDFTVVIGDAAQLRLRLSKRAQDLIRQQERVRVDLIADYNSRAGAAGTSRRNVRVYFPTKPGS
jgi:hypothetical protein